MISVSSKKWKEKKINSSLVEKIQQEHDFSKILSHLIVSRKFDENEIYQIKNNLELSNIFNKNIDFIKAVQLVEKSMKNRENICILGDYDVDGSVATSLLTIFFKSLKYPHFYYIPDRSLDGYGASKKLFKKLIKKKPKLVIMVDCGSTSKDAIDFLNENNINSLVIDHHEINKPYPKANIIINPKKDNGYLEYDYLCAASLTYFFLEMLIKKTKSKINLKRYLIYVLLATVCDVMPIRKLNRLISILVFKEFKINHNEAIAELYKLSNKNNKININDLSYLIGPILNAGGRLGKSHLATELLTADSYETINQKSLELIELNNKRRRIESAILKDINYDKLDNENKKIIIYYDPNINEGLIGIIASRLKDYFNKPSIVITLSSNTLKGSARSIYGYNIGRAIKRSLDKNFISKGGGHSMAAGFSLKKENLSVFKNFIIEDFSHENKFLNNFSNYDAEVSSAAFNNDFYEDINKIGPFGTGNPLPIFLFRNLKVIKTSILGEKHISCILKSNTGITINSIAFDSFNREIGKYLLNYKKNFNVIGQIKDNFWNNKRTLQLIIKDVIL